MKNSIATCGLSANAAKAPYTKKSFAKAETVRSFTDESKPKTN